VFFDGVHHWCTSQVYNLLRMASSAKSCDVKKHFVSGIPFFSTYTNIGIPFFYLRTVNKCSLMVYIMGIHHTMYNVDKTRRECRLSIHSLVCLF
jgi:hypothetical protein